VNRKAWIVVGCAFGLAVPVAIQVYEGMLRLWYARPVVFWLFFPTSLVVRYRFLYDGSTALLLRVLVILANALLYGWLAFLLRRAFLVLICSLLLITWLLLPPSNRTLTKRFEEHRTELDTLVAMADRDAGFTQIGPRVLKTTAGVIDSKTTVPSVLPMDRWTEYQRLFKALGLDDGFYRDSATGDVFIPIHTVGRVDPVGADLGYLHCASGNTRPSPWMPCNDGRDSSQWADRRWAKLGPGWYIFESFHLGIVN
jgi:hypothetical protein